MMDPNHADPSQDALQCERITRSHARTFSLASRLLPHQKRRAAYALYAFCRIADDLVDQADQKRFLNTTWVRGKECARLHTLRSRPGKPRARSPLIERRPFIGARLNLLPRAALSSSISSAD